MSTREIRPSSDRSGKWGIGVPSEIPCGDGHGEGVQCLVSSTFLPEEDPEVDLCSGGLVWAANSDGVSICLLGRAGSTMLLMERSEVQEFFGSWVEFAGNDGVVADLDGLIDASRFVGRRPNRQCDMQ
jgi:hypothetical protein